MTKRVVLVATRGDIDFMIQYGNCEVEPLQLQWLSYTAIFVSLGRPGKTAESGFSAVSDGPASRLAIA